MAALAQRLLVVLLCIVFAGVVEMAAVMLEVCFDAAGVKGNSQSDTSGCNVLHVDSQLPSACRHPLEGLSGLHAKPALSTVLFQALTALLLAVCERPGTCQVQQ